MKCLCGKDIDIDEGDTPPHLCVACEQQYEDVLRGIGHTCTFHPHTQCPACEARKVVDEMLRRLGRMRELATQLNEALLQWMAEPHAPMSATTESMVTNALKAYRTQFTVREKQPQPA